MVCSSSLKIVIFAAALTVRLIAVEISGANRISFGDAGDYVDSARWLCEEHRYPDRGNLPFFRAPGLPFFIASVTICHPAAVRTIKYALAVCDAFTCVLIASIAFMLFGRQVARLAGMMAVLDPIFIAAVCDVRSEPLFMLLVTLSLFLLLRERMAIAGVSIALASISAPVHSAVRTLSTAARHGARPGGGADPRAVDHPQFRSLSQTHCC
jgi:hypothetical protein